MRAALVFALLCAAACKRAPPGRIEEIAVGDHLCARFTSGEVRCWGPNGHGQLGSANASEDGVVAVRGATALAADSTTTCAVVRGGEVECWGVTWGRAGSERQRLPGVRGAVRLVLGAFRGCAVDAAGEATCWGPGSEGNPLGGWPPAKDERFRGALSGAGAGDTFCAVLPGKVHCVLEGTAPVHFDLPSAEAVAVTAPEQRVCTLRHGAVECGDVDASGKLTDALSRPLGFTALNGAGGELCGVLPSGEVRCATVNLLQRLERYEPVAGLVSPLQLAGGTETCALTRERAVACWRDRGSSHPGRVALPAPPFPH